VLLLLTPSEAVADCPAESIWRIDSIINILIVAAVPLCAVCYTFGGFTPRELCGPWRFS
jgi:hypothetical protein